MEFCGGSDRVQECYLYIRLLEKSRAGTLAKLLVGSLWTWGICLMRWIKQDPDHSKKTVNMFFGICWFYVDQPQIPNKYQIPTKSFFWGFVLIKSNA